MAETVNSGFASPKRCGRFYLLNIFLAFFAYKGRILCADYDDVSPILLKIIFESFCYKIVEGTFVTIGLGTNVPAGIG
jgi:hypothetical protein